MRKRRYEFNFWPGVADTMLVAFIIVLGLWFGHQSLTKLEEVTGSGGIRITGEQSEEYDRLKKRLPELERELVSLRRENSKLRADLSAKIDELARALVRIRELEDALAKEQAMVRELVGQVTKLKAEVGTLAEDLTKAQKVNDKPPIIELRETTKNCKFPSGSADLNVDFAAYLEKEVFPEILKILDRGDVNTIEVIGHTDGDSVRGRVASNLDAQLGNVLAGMLAAKELRPGSNADLGLIRAVAVRREIEAFLSRQGLSERIKMRSYSAANAVPLTDGLTTPVVFAGEEAARRRIEIRFTQLERFTTSIPPFLKRP